MYLSRRIFLAGLLTTPFAPSLAVSAEEKDAAFPPHKIAGNLYYVGSRDLAAYLIVTPQGNILINSCFAETVPLIQASVEKLGFRWTDTKILLDSHAHSDHVAGNALVRKQTGAKVYVMKGDEGIVRSGGKGDFQYTSTWEPCPVDHVLHDGEKVELGGSTLVARLTPGHTRGCTTWTMEIPEGKRALHAVIIGSPNVNAGYRLVGNAKYPAIATDFEHTFAVLKALPCDLFLGAHGAYYGLIEKYARLEKRTERNPFIDPAGYRAYVEDREKAFRDELARQKAVAQAR